MMRFIEMLCGIKRSVKNVAVVLLAGTSLSAHGSVLFQVSSQPAPRWYIKVQNQMENQYDGVAFTNEIVKVRALVKNTGDRSQSCTFHVEVETDDGQLEQYQWNVEKAPLESFAYTVTIPTDRFGFSEVRAWCTDVGGTHVLAKSNCGIAVVPTPRNYHAYDDQSFCGATYVNESEAGRRLGIKYNRIYVKWDRHEPVQGQFDWSYIDGFVDAHTNAFIYSLPTIRVESVPDWVTPWETGGDNTEFLSAWSNFVRQVAVRYGDAVGGYMIGAEPGRSLGQSFGGWLATGGTCYGKMLEAATGALNEADPDSPVIAFATTRTTLEHKDVFIRAAHGTHAAGYEYISHHAYPSPRTIGAETAGPGAMTVMDDSNWPNRFGIENVRDAGIRRQYQKVQHLSAEFGGGTTNLWPTEIGYTAPTDVGLIGPELFMHAGLCAQVYCVARTVPGVKRLMWFNMRYGGEDTAGYGLLRSDSARPAACAIATYNYLLHHAETGRFVCDREDLAIIRYEKPADAETVFALFRYNGRENFSASLSSGSRVWNSFGRTLSTGSIDLELGTLPVYITVADSNADSVETALSAAGNVAAKAQTLLCESFESGFGSFTSSGTNCLICADDAWAWDGDNALEIRGAAGTESTAVLSAQLDISAFTNVTVSFWYIGQSVEDGESFSVDYFDGTAWQPLETMVFGTGRFSDQNFYSESIELDAAVHTLSSGFRIRFTSGGSDPGDRVLIDEVCVRGVPDS
ncbi:hypothetical protein P4B35_10795 [Pontiellaceae bacterium B12227]|nr:hypothetical protein [Pontiellaceae bacterium B12227]